MRKSFFLILLLLCGVVLQAQEHDLIPSPDRDLFARISRIIHLPQGTHKIYNGKGSSVFDVLYTIVAAPASWTVYKGGTKSVFDILYSVKRSGNNYLIYKGSSDSSFNILYTIKLTGRGYEIYKGNSTFSFDLLYSYERD